VGDSIEVPLELDDFDVIRSERVGEHLEVHVRSTFPRACWHCGSLDVAGHGRHQRRIRDRSCGRPVVLVWHQRRFRCRDCGRTSRERHPCLDGQRRATERFRRQLFHEACERPFSEIAVEHRVSFYRVIDAFDQHAILDGVDIGRPRVLAMDESSFRKRFVFQTVLFDPLARRALAISDGRDQRSAQELLWRLPPEVRAGVETVVIDCHRPFWNAIREALPHARVVADKFHVLAAIDRAANRVRVRNGHKKNFRGRDGGGARQSNPRDEPRIYRARWAFAKRHRSLPDHERAELLDLFAQRPEVGVAWMLREAFAAIYEAKNRPEAERRLEIWAHHVAEADIPELTNVWRTMQWWREEILAYFDDRQTNAYAEGVTNKIKVMKRRSYGFRNRDRYCRKVLLTCRQPPRTGPHPPKLA
jgi:transposase